MAVCRVFATFPIDGAYRIAGSGTTRQSENVRLGRLDASRLALGSRDHWGGASYIQGL
jgi:hypothetical protein